MLNGPNLGRLGSREPDVYGATRTPASSSSAPAIGKELGFEVEVRETNDEGELIGWLHEAADGAIPVVLNPGAFTHYSYGMRDAAAQRTAPLIEVHISNPYAREEFRHTSVIAAVASGTVAGFGIGSYRLALRAPDRGRRSARPSSVGRCGGAGPAPLVGPTRRRRPGHDRVTSPHQSTERDGVAPDAARSGGSAAAAPPAGPGRPGQASRMTPDPPSSAGPRRPARRLPPRRSRLRRAPGPARPGASAGLTAPRRIRPRPPRAGRTSPATPAAAGRPRPLPSPPPPGRPGARHRSPCCSSARRARARPASPGTGPTTRRVPTAHISLDDVREWVRSGFADPQSGWNDHSEAQYRLARRTCGFAARNFLANGISCILDDAVFPDRPVVGLGGWKRHVGPGLLPVVLLPGLEIVLERNARRSGNRRLSDEEVARIHGRMAGWYGSGPADHRQLRTSTSRRPPGP